MIELLKMYEYKNRRFTVHGRRGRRIAVTSEGLPDGEISVSRATRLFHECVCGVGSDHTNLESALSSLCERMIEIANRKSVRTLCSELDEFYESLPEKE